MKKTLLILIASLLAINPYAQHINAQNQKTMRYGAGAEVSAIGGGGFLLGANAEYKGTFGNGTPLAHTGGANIVIGAQLGDGYHLLAGAGYEHNFTNDRGRFYYTARLNTPVVLVSGKYLLSEYPQYKDNFEVSAVIFIKKGRFGVGATYFDEYECSVVNAKFVWRFRAGGGGSTSCCGIY